MRCRGAWERRLNSFPLYCAGCELSFRCCFQLFFATDTELPFASSFLPKLSIFFILDGYRHRSSDLHIQTLKMGPSDGSGWLVWGLQLFVKRRGIIIEKRGKEGGSHLAWRLWWVCAVEGRNKYQTRLSHLPASIIRSSGIWRHAKNEARSVTFFFISRQSECISP